MRLRHLMAPLQTTDLRAAAAPALSDDANPVRGDYRNVLVSYGIHRGRFPIGGMQVRDARQVLRNLIDIDTTAVAVINGSPVDEEDVIPEDVTLLSFVKPSSLKG